MDNQAELKKIEEIINTDIRPVLHSHGGDLELVSFENNVLKINYQGACGGCPGATMGTLMAIQNVLKERYNPDIKVETA